MIHEVNRACDWILSAPQFFQSHSSLLATEVGLANPCAFSLLATAIDQGVSL